MTDAGPSPDGTHAPRPRVPAALSGISFRPVRPDETAECARIWRESINAYLRPLNQPDVPDELAPIGRLHAHTRSTDPDRFIVAIVPPGGPGAERIVGFGSAVVRGVDLALPGNGSAVHDPHPAWFLSMLFVRPEYQGVGLGRAILEQLLPAPDAPVALSTAIDSLQPISAALYSSFGMVPRVPLSHLVGAVRDRTAFPELPSGIRREAFEVIAAGPPDGPGHRRLVSAIDALDREIVGYAHPQDHRFLRGEARRGFLYLDGADEAVGYGYAGESGRVGPIAVRDPRLLEPVVGHLTGAVRARGAIAVWVPGSADRLLPTLLRAGLRIADFPLLLCWDRPFADFARYLPISPGLP